MPDAAPQPDPDAGSGAAGRTVPPAGASRLGRALDRLERAADALLDGGGEPASLRAHIARLEADRAQLAEALARAREESDAQRALALEAEAEIDAAIAEVSRFAAASAGKTDGGG